LDADRSGNSGRRAALAAIASQRPRLGGGLRPRAARIRAVPHVGIRLSLAALLVARQIERLKHFRRKLAARIASTTSIGASAKRGEFSYRLSGKTSVSRNIVSATGAV